jgi:hypothetical protein
MTQARRAESFSSHLVKVSWRGLSSSHCRWRKGRQRRRVRARGRGERERGREGDRESEREKYHQSGFPEAGVPDLGHRP